MRGGSYNVFALTIALSLAVARDRRKQARHVVRVDTWLCETTYDKCALLRKNLDE